jgi:O-succinylbenzoate synthase
LPDYWRYELTPKRRLSAIAAEGPRHGALIRVDGGFADIHPWPELGDPPLDEQLALLARGETTNLTRASLEFAAIDDAARRDGRSLFEGLTIPPSHWPGADPPDVFDTAKLKNIDRIPDNVRLRIDFNATLTPDEFLRIAATLPHERVDFIEDPCPYDAATWVELRARAGLRLALDRAGAAEHRQECLCHIDPAESPASGKDEEPMWHKHSCLCHNDPAESPACGSAAEPMWHRHSCLCFEGADVLVVKPAIQQIPNTDAEIVVTSYMDHPIGQLCAAYAAAKAGITTTCGLITHVLYEPDPFIERMHLAGTRLVPPGGTGWGFDDLLEKLPWKRL